MSARGRSGALRLAFLPCQTGPTAQGSRPGRKAGGGGYLPSGTMQDRVPPGGCACVYVYETDSCNCECFGEEPSGSAGVLTLGNKIDVSVSGIPLAQVAAQLARNVLVPASRGT